LTEASAQPDHRPPPIWDDVVGQPVAVDLLSRAARAGTGMTHAWLLTGPPGSGRSTAARAFAAALQCPDGGCGRCHECRTALAGSHADVTVVATEHVQLRVDDVRPLVQTAQQRPSGGRWRVLIIEDADRLNDSSGNVLLKAIEEPPDRTVWLLCAPAADDVLVTIRSRCRHVRLRIPPAADVAELLVRRHGADPAVAAFAARAAQSHIGMARRLALDEGSRIRRREVLLLPQQLTGVGAAVLAAGQLVEVAAEESKAATGERDAAERRATRAQRDVLDRALVDLLSLFRDVLVVQLGAPVELVNAELRAQVARLAEHSSAADTLRRMEAIGVARERIGANVAPLLAIEAVMVSLYQGGHEVAQGG
jgi:DNA polymerase III subunit delta'